uniref:Small ribosomal subunit protein mS31 n=1 Tax=Parascaris equorum TaxID=6256 RepID=A0A914RWJ2_PAREQ
MLYPESYRVLAPGGQMQMIVHPDQKVKNIFSMDEPRLDIFSESNIPKLKEHSLEVWANWDAHAARFLNKLLAVNIRVWNQSFGPTNGFEEMIDLTEKGKMWPYPIDNEYLLGDEENVGFHEHIFLERTLSQYKLPKTGPIAHFMELVCVGFVWIKTRADSLACHIGKIDFLRVNLNRPTFANYFDEKKTAEIERLHKEEQLAAANA